MSRRPVALGVAFAAALGGLGASVPVGVSGAADPALQARVEHVLERREQAWLSADAASWRATVDERAADDQTAQFEALGRLQLQAWAEELTALERGPGGSWRASVEVRYRFAGDRADALVDAVLTLSPGLLVTGATASPLPPWDIDGARTEAGVHSLVVCGASPDVLQDYVAELDRASASVGALLGEPAPRVVLVVPSNWDQARRMVPVGTGAGLAAVTTVLEPPGTPAGPVRVLADPGVLARLDPATRTAVFGHEAFHVATHGLGPVPLWLSEGLADYAGYRDSGVALESAVAGLRRHAAAHGAPLALPDDTAFGDPERATEAYEGAHLAVRMLAAEHGAAEVVALYRAVAADGPVAMDAALRELLDTDLAEVTASWRAEVASLAAG